MSAEMLRRAAALMRQRGEAATPGPWVPDAPGSEWRTWDGHVETHHPDFEECDNSIAKTLSNDDAQHIASWSPAVALAVADWLKSVAHDVAKRDDPQQVGGQHKGMSIPDERAALAVARAYLGGVA